ncbi:transferrin-like [Maniola jurtina]|uniref:transferrin-like n=1 Tax=Maniola jurtina TaxID=191418 RepID=UPI001E68D299|nr:transferrin-like [Maniola jurtina]
MGFKGLLVAVLLIVCCNAQDIGVCIPSDPDLCQNIERDGSPAVCRSANTRIDCALTMGRGQADVAVFSEEEMVLLSHQQPNDHRVVASIRDVSRTAEPFAFEAVAVVPASHTGGLDGLRGGRYCHPGLDQTELRWSPRVLKTLERAAARTDRCPGATTAGRTAEELEVETLSQFFGSACRPGPWSANVTVDADLKKRFPSLCSLCGVNSSCSRYTIDMGITVAGINNNNRHIQALECLRSNNNGTVAYVAWQHVREFFNIRNPALATSFALLCEDNSLRVLTSELLASTTAPCSFVKQPWRAIVASASRAAEIQANLQAWWPNGVDPGGNSWQTNLYTALVGGSNARVTFQETLQTPLEYTQGFRNLTTIDASSSCLPVHRWCTVNSQEHAKCMWLRNAAFVLGIEPVISCQMRATVFECLADIRNNAADFIATKANYGFLARQHYKLSAVKLVQNSRSNPASFSRVVALVKASSAESDITRFENLRGKRACFPEFGGISYMAFVRTAQERSVISRSECDYARAVGEFFDSACAPGAMANSHALGESSFNATNLCTACRSSVTVVGGDNFTCAYNHTNLFYGNNGTLSCLAQPENHVAFLELESDKIQDQLLASNLPNNSVRALCRNNTLALSTGVAIDSNCLLAFVVDSEVLARRNDITNSINTLLDTLDFYFGYNIGSSSQLINLRMYSPFDGRRDLLFLDTAQGLSEPSSDADNEQARNYNELFRHLETCTGAAAPVPGLAHRNFFSILTFVMSVIFTRYVIY